MSRPDLDALLNALLPFAKQMLAKHGEFHPFGASMNNDGEISMTAGYTGDEHPEASEVIELLEQALRDAARRERAPRAQAAHLLPLRPAPSARA